MKSPACERLAASIGAALIVLALGGVAHAQKLYTDREVELRSSPGDDSQVVKRVAKGKSLEVTKRLGTWVRVKYEGRTGWVRRTALSEAPGGGGDDDAKDSAKEEEPPKAAAAGAKRTAAKKKAERKKSRAARHKAVRTEETGETLPDDVVESEDDSGKPRSSWSERGREAGGPMKVEVQALSVRAFSKPNGKGKVVFTLAEGDIVRVVERGENRYLLVENSKKNTGWIPASSVRDSGNIPEARKSATELAEEAGDEEEAEEPKRVARGSDDESDDSKSSDEDDDGESKTSKKTRTAAADDEDEDSGDESSDEAEASLSDTSDDAMMGKPKPWAFVGGLRAGFTSVGMDVTPTGQDAEVARYNGPIAGLDGQFTYRIRPKIGIIAQLGYDWATALGGLTFQAGGNDEITDISLMTHRIGASAGVAYGKRAVGSFRLGYQYMSFQISDLANAASWPRETTSGPTAGLGFAYAELAGKLGARVGVDAMLLGNRTQTEGLRDGTEFDSLTSLWGSLRLDYPVGKNLVVDGGYRFGYASSTWTGVSERNSGTDTERTETSHEISIGAGWRL